MRDLLLEVYPFLTLLVLVVVMASIIIAIRVLRNTRRILRLSERRMDYLTDERDRLKLLREERGLLEEMLEQERKERLAAQQRVGLATAKNVDNRRKGRSTWQRKERYGLATRR
jgi:hypothetical protein